MIELNQHIEVLLLSNDCVIVPNLGGFVAHHVDARYDTSDGTYLPPLRSLGFNPSLKLNDHLLVQSYIETYDISYPEALRRIENEVEELKQHLENEGQYELSHLGVLSINDEGNYQFTPSESGIVSPALYGLSLFEMSPLAATEDASSATIIPLERKESEQRPVEVLHNETADETIVIRMSWLRNIAVVAAAVIMFFFVTPPINNSKQYSVQEGSIFPVMSNASTEENEDTLARDTTAVTQTAPEATTVQTKESTTTYAIVMASQTTRFHANQFIERLNKDGLTDAHISKMTNTDKVRVVYGNYNAQEDAYEALNKLRADNRNVFKDAWVLKLKSSD